MRAAGLPAVVVNSAFRAAPWADLLFAHDKHFWLEQPDARSFAGIKVCGDDSLLWPDVMSLRHTGKAGLDSDPTCIRSGCNSGYSAVHIAVQAGATRVLLFGFDMRGGHWDNPDEVPSAERFSTWLGHFAGLAAILAERGVEVINCTPGSAMRCFPCADFSGLPECATSR